jgi:hypothetical protein
MVDFLSTLCDPWVAIIRYSKFLHKNLLSAFANAEAGLPPLWKKNRRREYHFGSKVTGTCIQLSTSLIVRNICKTSKCVSKFFYYRISKKKVYCPLVQSQVITEDSVNGYCISFDAKRSLYTEILQRSFRWSNSTSWSPAASCNINAAAYASYSPWWYCGTFAGMITDIMAQYQCATYEAKLHRDWARDTLSWTTVRTGVKIWTESWNFCRS